MEFEGFEQLDGIWQESAIAKNPKLTLRILNLIGGPTIPFPTNLEISDLYRTFDAGLLDDDSYSVSASAVG